MLTMVGVPTVEAVGSCGLFVAEEVMVESENQGRARVDELVGAYLLGVCQSRYRRSFDERDRILPAAKADFKSTISQALVQANHDANK